MDALSTTPTDATGAHGAATYATPAESPLAMPTQRLSQFDSRTRHKPRARSIDLTALLARVFVFGGGVALTIYGATEMYGVINVGVITTLKWALLVLFIVNFSWIAIAFTSAIVGFWWMLSAPRPKGAPAGLHEQTAVVMPIYNEEPSRVFSAMQAMIEEVNQTGHGAHFDWFLLSDSTNPDVWLAEEQAYIALRERLGDTARVYYRHRAKNTSRKAGNIDDFVQRWGGAYAHMLVLDADSLMTGEAITALAAAMEADPDAGIIQSLPLIINRNTFFARLQHLRQRHRRRPRRLVRPPGELLGPQRHHPHQGLRGMLWSAASARPPALRRPHHEPRFRGGGADGARRLFRLHAAHAARQLRGEPALADRRGDA
jgi:membrane glycosyltransferase